MHKSGGIGRGKPVANISSDDTASQSVGGFEIASGANGLGSGSRNFGSSTNFSSSRFSRNVCKDCGDEGHFHQECPKRGEAGAGAGQPCHKCGQRGHRAADCTAADGGQTQGFGAGGFGSGGFGNSGGFGTSRGGDNGNNRFGSGGDNFGNGSRGFGSSSGGRACRRCGKEGHFIRDCTETGGSSGDGLCRKCHEPGHLARECPSGGGSFACRRCGANDHMVRDCPQPEVCFNCQQEGHLSKDCQNEHVPRAGDENRKKPQTYEPKELTVDDLERLQRIHTGINFDRYYDIKVQVTGSGEHIQPINSFEEAGFTDTILGNVLKAAFTKPTPIQRFAIPIITDGHDLMACAQTGSGKTAAYLLPVLTCMIKRGELSTQGSEIQEPSAIVVVPTRELVSQIENEARFFAKGTVANACKIYGGTRVQYQIDRLRIGCNVLVATPGRLAHFISQGSIGLSKCRYLILDEADRMLDMGFETEIRKLIDNSGMPMKSDRQTLMFSATFPTEIQRLAQDFLKNNFAFVAVGVVGGANSDIVQEFEQHTQHSKKDRLIELLQEDIKNSLPGPDGKYLKKTLVFVERKRNADFLACYLSDLDIKSTSIHGDREQYQREEALSDFKTGKCSVLVATAVAARGLDIVGVDHVINCDMPNSIDDYVHRIGRTGRVGNPGRATSFFDSSVDSPLAAQLIKVLADAQQVVPDWLHNHVSEVNLFAASGPNQMNGFDYKTDGANKWD